MPLQYSVSEELKKLASLASSKSHGEYYFTEDAPFIFSLSPKSKILPLLNKNHDTHLTLMVITHGNEVMGLAALNMVLDSILRLKTPSPINLRFIIGNPEAALANVRFKERDLNRSFDRAENQLLEEKRADIIEPFLKSTSFYIDFHQTNLPSHEPFFIFPFEKRGWEFARTISPTTTIVTHWGDPFSTDGRCTDEYVIRQGGIGITLETGQNGFEPRQMMTAVLTCLQAIHVVSQIASGKSMSDFLPEKNTRGKNYTFAHVMKYPQDGYVKIKDGFINFSQVSKGDLFAHHEGNEIKFPCSGEILFPAYRTQEEVEKKRPTELCRILKEVEENELPF